MKEITVTIKQIENSKGKYVAYYKNEFLNSTFAIYFTDSLQGSVALIDFSNMLKSRYKTDDINFEISNEKVSFKSQALLDAMFNRRA